MNDYSARIRVAITRYPGNHSYFKYASLEDWVSYAKSPRIVCALVSVLPNCFPGESTYRDFYDRLWQDDEPNKLRSFTKNLKLNSAKINFLQNDPLPSKGLSLKLY